LLALDRQPEQTLMLESTLYPRP